MFERLQFAALLQIEPFNKQYFEEMKMTSYLDDANKINKKRYIVSLEQLFRIDIDYDVVILDGSEILLINKLL